MTPEIESKFSRTRLQGGEVLLTLVGSTGQSIVAPKQLAGWNVPRAVAVIRASEDIGADWINICLQTEFTKHFLDSRANTTVQKTLNLSDVKKIPIPIPPNGLKKFIESNLLSLDKKIQLNRQTNQTLEQMAQALFKSWFVDFDPVIDNALEAGNEIPEPLKKKAERRAAMRAQQKAQSAPANQEAQQGAVQTPLHTPSQTQSHATKSAHSHSNNGADTNTDTDQVSDLLTQSLPEHLRALFPSEFEETDELGWVPKGWEVGSVNDVAKTNPQSWSKKNAPKVVEYIDLANAKNGNIEETISYSYDEAPSRARRILEKNDTIIGLVRPGNRSFAYVHQEGLTGSTGFAVMAPLTENRRAYLYFLLTQDDVINEFARLADGAAYPAIRPEVVTNMVCVVPPDTVLNQYQLITGTSLNKIGCNFKQNNELEKLRDTLLPKLISGELRLPEMDTAPDHNKASA